MWKKIDERIIDAKASSAVMMYVAADYIKDGDYSFIVTVCIAQECSDAICMGTFSQIKKGGEWRLEHITAKRVKEEARSHRRLSMLDWDDADIPEDFVFHFTGKDFPDEV